MNPQEITARLASVRDRIAAASVRSKRDPSTVRIVAIAKTFPADVVLAARAAGLEDVGENRAQELKEKVALIGNRVRWHFVGHLQTNKVRHVVGSVVMIHSVDRYGLAEAVARRARTLGIEQDLLIEVNVAGERTKQGVEPARALDLGRQIAAMAGVRVRGLMTMAPFASDPETARPYFTSLAALGAEMAATIPGATELSMGMSGDFEVAVEEGATLVRLGEALLGPRGRR